MDGPCIKLRIDGHVSRTILSLSISSNVVTMNIALIGATGFVGSNVLEEALSRGHRVTALSRHPSKTMTRLRGAIIPKVGDVNDIRTLSPLLMD